MKCIAEMGRTESVLMYTAGKVVHAINTTSDNFTVNTITKTHLEALILGNISTHNHGCSANTHGLDC